MHFLTGKPRVARTSPLVPIAKGLLERRRALKQRRLRLHRPKKVIEREKERPVSEGLVSSCLAV
jgi:hypothetical protein